MGKKVKGAKKKPAPVMAEPKKDGFLNSIIQHPFISILVTLATFIGLFFSIYPRSDTQLNKKVDYLTNAASASVDNGNTFSLMINGQYIPAVPPPFSNMDTTKFPVITLSTSREVSIQPANEKPFAIDKMIVRFFAPLAATNVNMSGTWGQPVLQRSDNYGDWNGWTIVTGLESN